MGEFSPWLWAGFLGFVCAMLALDLGLFQRKAHAVTLKEAALWSAAWVGLALAFNAGLYFWRGPEPALQFLTGYVIEKALSVDNLFVFALLFGLFAVPAAYQHRVLFWGVLGALLMRGLFVVLGAALIERFHWVLYLFGAFLVYTGIRLAFARHEAARLEANPLLRLARRFVPVTTEYRGERLFVRQAGKLLATPLFLVLIAIESTDLVFALDSIPAVFAVTRDPFLVYTSNVFAILGLRSLYFLLAGALDRFHYLKPALAVILSFVGIKMIVADFLPIPTQLSLAAIGGILSIAIAASLLRPRELATVEERAEG